VNARAGREPLPKLRLNGLKVFSTCPVSSEVPPGQYLEQVINVARWSEACGYTGILIDADKSLADPWLIAHTIIRHTRMLFPLVVVRPFYLHPYTLAKIVTTIDCLYRRRVILNMVAGSPTNELASNDSTPRDKRRDRLMEYAKDSTGADRRYERLVEYAEIVKRLLGSSDPLTYHGEFYTVDQLKVEPTPAPEVCPRIFVSSGSDAGASAAVKLGAIPIKPPTLAADSADGTSSTGVRVAWGIRVGILSRSYADEAWEVAAARFPQDRRSQSAGQGPDAAAWPKQPVGMLAVEKTPYWLGPSNSYHQTMCPYLVGGYEQVAGEVVKYVGMGCHTFIVDVPPIAEELNHAALVFSRAGQQLKSRPESARLSTRAVRTDS
jgi:alkanesulfonate monooxygenase